MFVIFAYHDGDADLALMSSEVIKHFGWNANHEAAILAPTGCKHYHEIKGNLQKAFPTVHDIMATPGFNGYPLGPNQMFADALAWACYNQGWFYFFEADICVMHAGWCDKLEAEARKARKPVMGVKHDDATASDGSRFYKHITGAAIYNCSYGAASPLARSIPQWNREYLRAGAIPPPWDVYIAKEIWKNDSGHECKFMASYGKTGQYIEVNGLIKFKGLSDKSKKALDAYYGFKDGCGTVKPGMATIHGCKDSSLYRIAMGQGPKILDADVALNDKGEKAEYLMKVAKVSPLTQNEGLLVTALEQSPGMTRKEIGIFVFAEGVDNGKNYAGPTGKLIKGAIKKKLIEEREVSGVTRYFKPKTT